ncbi:hypothetical protein R3P38DRAFT_3492333 [Favolaschia claudopus]|uniref:Uncharacterized protein n=1 Tax=Favolaschia claudopus TaxID=2862362 RepID=A0AAW0ED85_9AGAR
MESIEQDRLPTLSGDDLPTYDDLAAQEGPNSRFGRWRGWIEKRAAERYLSITPDERQRRRERGWGNEEMDALDPEPLTPTTPGLSIQTRHLRISTLSEPPPTARIEPPLPPLPPVSTVLRPTHLKMHHFGSRFLPHTTTPIRCLLPLQAGRLLLLGHDEGLSVMDMYPQEWNDSGGIDLKGPDEAAVHTIWQGEIVFQMSILELDQSSGVVLMLVGPEPESPLAKDSESRTVRMYNLASLTSLAKWAVANKGAHPLELSNFAAQQTPTKKHRPTSSFVARGLKSLIPPAASSSSASGSSSSSAMPESSSGGYQALLTPQSSISGGSPSRQPSAIARPPPRTNSDESSWEMVDDLPLRVLSFALWTREEGARMGSRGQYLAVATKNNILLYETPQNERAFRFVKEFYTPLQPKAMCFFQQTVHDRARSSSDSHSRHRRSGSHTTSSPRSSSITASSNTINYGTQLAIFVIFEKKAGWIRLADSAVGEMELFENGTEAASPTSLSAHSPHHGHARTASASPSSLRTRHGKHAGGKWLLPTRCELPTRSVYILTRGTTSHVVPCPLPSNAGPVLAVLAWRSPPAHVAPRLGVDTGVLQLTALGEGSVEVVEVPLAALGGVKNGHLSPGKYGNGSGLGHAHAPGHGHGNGNGNGKGKARMDDGLAALVQGPVRAEEDAGGETGFLCVGGHWDDPHQGALSLQRTASNMSGRSMDSVDSDELVARIRREQGIYGWCRKGVTDWRVFWLGGSFDSDDEEEEGE